MTAECRVVIVVSSRSFFFFPAEPRDGRGKNEREGRRDRLCGKKERSRLRFEICAWTNQGGQSRVPGGVEV